VPEILAAIIIANHPEQYGFDDLTLDPPVLTDTVAINYPVNLRLISDLVGAPVDELKALNPSLLRMMTPPNASFDLHLPGGLAAVYEQRVALIPDAKRNAWRYHRVKSADTLASVARDFHVTESELAAANQLSAGDGIEGVEALAVPAAPVAEPAARTPLYTVRRGDTLVTIADRFGVSLIELRRWNRIPGLKVQPGQRLRVSAPVSAQRTAAHSTPTHSKNSSGTQAHTHSQAAPAKGSATKPAAPSAQKRSASPTAKKAPAKHSSTTGSTRQGRTTSAKNPHARSKATGARRPAKK
jgi:membrane-bound lytic murein transglycosylase D